MKKKTSYLLILLIGLFSSVARGQKDIPETHIEFVKDKKINVAFLIYDQVEALDLNGPIDVFAKANLLDPRYNLYTVAQTDDKVTSEGGVMGLMPTYDFKKAPKADILVVPGAHPDIVAKLCEENQELLDWVRQQDATSKITMSVCVGGIILSKAGLLNGKKATTHFMTIEALRSNSEVNVVDNVRFVQDGKIITTAGITSGIDGTLHLIDLINGKKVGDKIAEILYYNRNLDMGFMKS
ncbi:DJ-1/PfpI family protein [Arenibacter nanhaiticus]|nr:DJ-1/PfpI family protein [Arenibacter nanhaiticus]